MIPTWVRAGACCICIDENWQDDFGEEVPGPMSNEMHVVTGWHVDSGEVCIRVLGWSCELSFSAAAFRPLTKEESDLLYFNSLITDSSVPVRTPERACSR